MAQLKPSCIYLTEPQKSFIKKKSDKLGIKSSEFLRRILDEYIKKDKEESK